MVNINRIYTGTITIAGMQQPAACAVGKDDGIMTIRSPYGPTCGTGSCLMWEGASVMVDFVKSYIDEGNVPETTVDGVVGINRISEGQILVTYYRRRNGQNIVAAHMVWDFQTWLQMWQFWHDRQYDIRRECIEMQVVPDERQREMH